MPVTYNVYAIASSTRASGRPRPGIVFVCTSSLKCGSLDYAKDHFCRAPRVSGLTERKIYFARSCTTYPISSPSQTTLLANGCPTQVGLASCVPKSQTCKPRGGRQLTSLPFGLRLSGSRVAVTRTFERGKCSAFVTNG